MRFRSVSRAWLGALLLLGLAARTGFARTQLPSPAPVAAAPAPAPGPLRVWVDTRGVSLDTARLRESLARELGREIMIASDPAASDVRIQLKSEARAEVRYTTPEGEQLSRDVELPPDRDRSLQVLSWLTVNLVRDEASELLSQLRARRQAEAEARAAEEKAAQQREAERLAAAKAAADAARAKAEADAARAKAEAASAAAQPAAKDELLRDRFKIVDVALATPMGLLPDSPKRELRLQLALGYGDAGQIRGIQASPSVLRIRRDLQGISAGVGFVLIGGDAYGIVVSAGYPRVEGRLAGIAVGGGAASARTLQGALVAGGATWVSEPSRGLMMSGGANLAGDLQGIQVSSGINIARDLRGVAVAPVNAQRRVRGVQFGVINIAEEVDGAAIGVVSLARNGRLQPVIWGSRDGSAHLAFKSIAGYAFTQFGGGISLNGKQLSYDGGIGAHFKIGSVLFLEPGVHYSATHQTADASGNPDQHYLYYLAQLGLRVGNSLDLLAGGGIRHLAAGGSGTAIRPEVRAGIAFF
ncbi:MAG TPA: hypothetical protein VEX18_20610 [Polyangiaceae bacterium]|nr:hypothetical protein [Polyangiaceae bacterium]